MLPDLFRPTYLNIKLQYLEKSLLHYDLIAGTLNPNLFMASGGVAALTRNLMECQTPKIAEALCGVLLLLLDRPVTRNQAAVDLHCVAAPYCDFHYRHGWMDKNR